MAAVQRNGEAPGRGGVVASAVIIVLAAAGGVGLEGAPAHAWLAWPWWAQAASAIVAATIFISLSGPFTGVVMYFLFAACFLFLRGPAPGYQVVPELLPPIAEQQERQ